MFQCCVLCQMMLLCSLLLLPLPAMAISTLSIAPAREGAFLLSGADFDELARIDVTVSYDTSLLTNPRVVREGFIDGATLTVNCRSAGAVGLTVTASKAIKGNGSIATLTFERIGDAAGMITSLNGKVVGLSGAVLPVLFTVTNPPPPPDPLDDLPMQPDGTAEPLVQGSTSTASTTANSAGQPFVGGTLNMPAEEAGVAARREQPASPAEPRETVAAPLEADAPPTPGSQEMMQPAKAHEPPARHAQSALERFRLFEGERSAKNLAALFEPAEPVSFRQDPPVFIADGEGRVRVTIFNLSGDKAPIFSFCFARYVSFLKVSEGEWVVEIRPDKGVLSASFTVLMNGSLREIPLTVSPKAQVDLIKPGKASEADFALFLKERGTASVPRFDLNGDGKRDYQDDYIFTANYLVEQGKKARKEPVSARGGAVGNFCKIVM